MNTMNMPGFTAEDSLYNGNVHYQVTTEVSVYSGIVQPAFRFDITQLYTPYTPIRLAIPCVKTKCFPRPFPLKDLCVKLPGYYNFDTQMCE